MKFEKTRGQGIWNEQVVSVKKMNHIVEVVAIDSVSNGLSKIKKLSKTHYVNKDTGEILAYKLSENRGQNIAGLKQSFSKIRDLINNNFTGKGNEIHVVLTYAENMTDSKRLYKDFDKFWKRYKYKYGSNCDYLSVVEPQGRGAWHCHVLIRHNDVESIYIPSEELARLWGHGFVKIRSLEGVDNIGAYLTAYLTDVELTEETLPMAVIEKREIKVVEVEGKQKRYIKGGRMHLYPPGMNLFRKSRGIVYPEVEKMKYKEIKKIIGNASPDYTTTITIQDEDKKRVLNRITYEHYNMKRRINKVDSR